LYGYKCVSSVRGASADAVLRVHLGEMNLRNAVVAAHLLLLAVSSAVACESSGSSSPGGTAAADASVPPPATTLTYYHDVQPIIEAKCQQCHNPQGIGPFAFETPDDVISRKALVGADVSTKRMPPWPPSSACNSYEHDRSLSQAEITTITSWIAGGAPVGDPKNQVKGTPPTGLSRVDLTLQNPTPFTPNGIPVLAAAVVVLVTAARTTPALPEERT